MLFKYSLWILSFWLSNAYSLVIENLLTGESLLKSSKGNYSVYNFVTDDTIDILCRRDDRSKGTLGWVLQTSNPTETTVCETVNEESIRYRVILTGIDHRRSISCTSKASDGSIETLQIALNYTGIISDDAYESSCTVPTQVTCLNQLNRVFMNITVNGKVLSPVYDSYLPTYEFLYNYNISEDIKISCLSYLNPTSFISMCSENFIEPQQPQCVDVKLCNVSAEVNLQKENNNTIVYCYTSNDNEPLASVRLIAQTYDADLVPHEKTTSKPDGTGETNTKVEIDINVITKDLDDKPVIDISPTDFYTIIGCTVCLIVITIIVLIYILRKKLTITTSEEIPLERKRNEKAWKE